MALLTVQDIETTIQSAADDERESYDSLLDQFRSLESLLAEVVFKIGDAEAELDRALSHLPFRPVSAADAIGQAKSILRFAQSATEQYAYAGREG